MAKLSSADRKALPASDFAIPSKRPGPGSYPDEDISHARNALSRASGKPVEGQVDAAVYRKYPSLKPGSKPTHKAASRAGLHKNNS